ncbi:hypothetical protein JL721_9010 [Aureococcus anophagefferens]|nr:hypothetical protein JL721_9010 [Aureococcus anophagefferens]
MVDVSELSQRVLQLTLDDEPAQLRAALQDLEPEDERGFAATTDEGAYATHIAANFGRFHCLAELLDRGCPALRMPSGHTPLMVACQSGAVDCVAALVEFYPEDVRAFTGRGHTQRHTALMIAMEVLHGDEARAASVARLLLRGGADPLARRPAGDGAGSADAALYECCGKGCAKLARVLVEEGPADQLAWTRASGHTCLHAAAEAKHAACLRAVVAAAAAAPGGRAALARARAAARTARRRSTPPATRAASCVRALLPVSDVDARMRPPYASPLYVAAAGGYGACVAEILAHGGTAPRARGDHGPLHAAACSGDVECVARILAADAGALERRDPEARTPLAKAVQNSRVDAAVFLVVCGARPVYADAPEVGSPDDVPVVDGAARAEVAVDLVDEAHARGAPGLAEWLREVDVFAGAAAGLPLLCFANDIPAAWHPTLLRAGADPDVEPLGAFGRALWAGDERGDDATWVPMARRPWRPDSHFLYPAARGAAEAAAAVGWALERDGRRHSRRSSRTRSCPTPCARAGRPVVRGRRAPRVPPYLGGVVT